jgi:hypothetical protein
VLKGVYESGIPLAGNYFFRKADQIDQANCPGEEQKKFHCETMLLAIRRWKYIDWSCNFFKSAYRLICII